MRTVGIGVLAFLFIATFPSCASAPLPIVEAGGLLESFKNETWWMHSYPKMIEVLSSQPDSTWRYQIPARDEDPLTGGKFRVTREEAGAVLLVSTYRQQAIDPNTGAEVPGEVVDVVMKIRDRNADGVPDEFRGEPFFPEPGEVVADNGFIQIRDHRDHHAILVQWDTFIGIVTQHLLHRP